MRIWRIARKMGAVIGFLMFISGCFSAAFFATSLLYDSISMYPSAFIRQLINALLGFFLFVIAMFIIGRLMHPKRLASFQPMVEAIRRMTKGDFNVTLNIHVEENHPIGELAQSINDMAVELRELERMRQEFISNVSHEIQSPLTSISGFARALQNDALSPLERNHYLSIIEKESLRLSKLSENLLKLTSLESDHHPFELKSYRLDKQLRDIVLSYEPQWMDKEIEMNVSFEKVNIVADEDLLSQVWVNLINNAIKFTPNKGTIGIHLKQCEDEVVVRISDTGIGIAEIDQKHIFERFYKADKSRSGINSGSGLGLSIVKKIVDMHKGSICVHSEFDEGSTFTVSLPMEHSVGHLTPGGCSS